MVFWQATSGQDPDKVEMGLIEEELRKQGIALKRKAGLSSLDDGIATMDDVKTATKTASVAMSLFGGAKVLSPPKDADAPPKNDPADSSGAGMKKFGGSWKRMKTTMTSITMINPSLLKDLEALADAAS